MAAAPALPPRSSSCQWCLPCTGPGPWPHCQRRRQRTNPKLPCSSKRKVSKFLGEFLSCKSMDCDGRSLRRTDEESIRPVLWALEFSWRNMFLQVNRILCDRSLKLVYLPFSPRSLSTHGCCTEKEILLLLQDADLEFFARCTNVAAGSKQRL